MISKLIKPCGVFAAGFGTAYLCMEQIKGFLPSEKNREMLLTAEKVRQQLQSYPQIGGVNALNFFAVRNTECARTIDRFGDGKNNDPTASCLRSKNTLIGRMFKELKEKENGISQRAISTDDEMRQLRLLAAEAVALKNEANLVVSDAKASIEVGKRFYAYQSFLKQEEMTVLIEEGEKTLALAHQINKFSEKLNDSLHHNWRVT